MFKIKVPLEFFVSLLIESCQIEGIYFGKINEEMIKYKRNEKKFFIVIGDIDFFKKFNDTYGQDFGDLVLKKVSL